MSHLIYNEHFVMRSEISRSTLFLTNRISIPYYFCSTFSFARENVVILHFNRPFKRVGACNINKPSSNKSFFISIKLKYLLVLEMQVSRKLWTLTLSCIKCLVAVGVFRIKENYYLSILIPIAFNVNFNGKYHPLKNWKQSRYGISGDSYIFTDTKPKVHIQN